MNVSPIQMTTMNNRQPSKVQNQASVATKAKLQNGPAFGKFVSPQDERLFKQMEEIVKKHTPSPSRMGDSEYVTYLQACAQKELCELKGEPVPSGTSKIIFNYNNK